MKRFLIHIAIFCSVVIGTIVYILSLANGYSDSFYLKLTTPKQSNLIIGTSKAAQGLQPNEFETILNKSFYNYAFTIYSSPYGSVYLNSIKKKLNTQEKNGTYVLTVDAWSISIYTENPEKTEEFRENTAFLSNITNVTQKPNYKYLLNNFKGKYLTILTEESPAFLHNNGWLEVNLDNDEQSIKRRTLFSIKGYENKVQHYYYSQARVDYLLETIDYLNKHGKVYLVRLPVSSELMEIEGEFMPDFNTIIEPAIEKTEGYLDLTPMNKDFIYTDGVHLNKSSGKVVSSKIATWIKSIEDAHKKEN